MNIHSRIRAAREKAKLSLNEVARRMDVSRQAATAWEEEGGSLPRRKNLNLLADVLNVSVDWLLTGNDANLDLGGKYVFIRRYIPKKDRGEADLASHVSVAGWKNDEDTYAFRTDWIERRGLRPLALTMVECNDDLMEPTFYKGDPLLVNTDATTIEDRGVYAFDHPSGVQVRRCFVRLDNLIVLHVDSGKRPDEVITPGSFEVIGRVVTAMVSV